MVRFTLRLGAAVSAGGWQARLDLAESSFSMPHEVGGGLAVLL